MFLTDYVPYKDIQSNEVLKDYLVSSEPIFTDYKDVVNMTGIEGRIVITKDNLWYSEIHKAKDELSSPRKVLLAVANEVYDDLYVLASEQERK